MGALRKNPITVISLTSGHDSSPKKKSQLVGDSRISESQDIQSISPFLF
jgi:hypothetical protein